MKKNIINKNELSDKPIGCVLGSEADDGRYIYKNIVIGYIGDKIILFKTNLTQVQFDRFCQGKLSNKELDECI